MNNKNDISNATVSALYGAEKVAAPRKPSNKKVKVSRRPSAHKHNHVRSHNFNGNSHLSLYGVIFAACSLVSFLLYAAS